MPDPTPCYLRDLPWESSSGFLFFDFRIQYRQLARYRYRRLEAPPSDAKTSVQLVDASDLKGVHATAVKLSSTSKRDAPPLSLTTGVQLTDASELTSVSASAVEVKSSDTSKRKAPPPEKTTAVQLTDASDFTGEFARVVKHKSSDTSKHDAPPPDSVTGVQLAGASELTSVCAGAVEDKSSGTSKRKASPPDSTTGVPLTDAGDGKGVYARPVKDKSSGTIKYKYEPRFTPPREEVEDGTTRKFNRLSLGEYFTRYEAKIMLHIARFYYGKDKGCVELENGQFKFFIPPMNEQERGLAGEQKRKWVTKKSKQVYADLVIQKRNFEQLSLGMWTGTRSSHDKDIGVSEISTVPSANVLEFPMPPSDVVDDCCETFSGLSDMIVDLPCPNSPNSSPQQSSLNCEMRFLEIQAVASANALEVPSCPAPLSPCDFAEALEGPSCRGPLPPCDIADALEVPSCHAPLLPCNVAGDYCETLSGFSDMIDGLQCPDSPNSLPQQSSLNCDMHLLGFGQIHGGPSSTQADGVTQFIQTFSVLSDMDVDLPCPDSPDSLPLQSSLNCEMRFSEFGQVLGAPSSPQTDGVTQFFQDSIDAQLSPRIDFQQGWDLIGASGSNFFAKPRDPVLQQLVHRQKQQLQVYVLRIVDLEHQLCESQIQNSELQQEIERLTGQFSNGSLI